MGSMSASDAAPLPRLGEVFFDVRGSARSMRLSWYADTGVAVFSIWQAGTCTGTFRLPMGELQRMIETLRHGPGGRLTADQAGLDRPPTSHTGQYLPEPQLPGPRTEGQRDALEVGPLGRQGGHVPGSYRPAPGPLDYESPGPLDYESPGPLRYEDSAAQGFPAGPGPLEYAGERTQAPYLPAPPDLGYDPDSGPRAAVSLAHNGEAVSGQGARGRPPESFPYAP